MCPQRKTTLGWVEEAWRWAVEEVGEAVEEVGEAEEVVAPVGEEEER